MGADFWIVLRWWGTLFLVGAVAFPLTKRLFSSWFDQGYFFAKAVGMAVVTWIVFTLGTIRAMPFSVWSIGVALGVVFLLGIVFHRGDRGDKGDQGDKGWIRGMGIILFEEVFFFAALLFWSWIKGHEPSIHGLEKFMDYGFMKSILNSAWFPAADMWYAGSSINYYYFGHTVVAVLTKLSGIDLAYTFNLMLASIFALTLTMSFSIGKQIGGGLLTAFLVTLAGNMQTIYAFTKGYDGDAVKPFWELLGKMDLNRYWYANATRFIPFTIHEFPSYSFVVSDVHGHVLSLPFVLLTIGLLIAMFGIVQNKKMNTELRILNTDWLRYGFYGLLVAVLLMTNALDGPIYLGLFVLAVSIRSRDWWIEKGKIVGVVGLVASVTSLPFLLHFKSFVSGLAVNCPLPFLANTKIGPILFEGVEKCQHSPLWMWWLLWGFFIYCGTWLICTNRAQKLLITFFLFALALVIFPEFFYFKDIYPVHFRSNTMFKLGYQAFILFSIVSAYSIVTFVSSKKFKTLFIIFLLPQLFLVSIFPIFSVRSYFDSLKTYKGLDGTVWLKEQYPDDWAGIEWLNKYRCQLSAVSCQQSQTVIVEADGDSYSDYARFSAFSGLPTIIGWPVHEWLWRGTYDVVAPRREEVRVVYESEDIEQTRAILQKYNVRYIIVGVLEQQKYTKINEEKLSILSRLVFSQGNTRIYFFPLTRPGGRD